MDVQVSTGDVLDTKATGAFSLGSTVLPVTVGLLTFTGRSLSAVTVTLLVLALVAYGVLLVFAWRASMVRGLEYRTHIPTLERHSQTLGGDIPRRWAAEEYAASSLLNRSPLTRKARYVGVATTALLTEGLLLSLAALSTLL